MRFDRIAILDWSAAKGPKRGKDSIWLADTARHTCTTENLSTRAEAEASLADLMQDALARNQRLLLGADFAFGAPSGFVAALTGRAEALAWWHWLAARVQDTPVNISNYRQIAAEMNRNFAGDGPFWGNGEKVPTPDLPRLKPSLPDGLLPHRATDIAARGPGSAPKPIWQLAGAGAVGAQVLTGLPVLHRLRQRFAPDVAVWPFEAPTAPIVMAEVYPSLLADAVRRDVARTQSTPDEAQVRLLATALHRLTGDDLTQLFTLPHSVPEEGWILGAGQASLLQQIAG
jgi:molybdopterin molybdotransferase